MVAVTAAVTRFADEWEKSLLITADMPAPDNADAPGPLQFGFKSWPCGAFDPVSGASVHELHWWTPPPPGTFGLMGQDQVNRYESDREDSLART